jgi:uncharacterized protein
MKPFIAPLLAAAVFSLGAAAPAAQAADNKVVIQVSDNDEAKWNLILNNAKNLQSALGKDNVDIEIVAFGPGINMFKMESTVGNRVSDARASGVKVEICENTMKAMKLAHADMLDNVGYVPGGVVEIMQRQKQGWTYLRP